MKLCKTDALVIGGGGNSLADCQVFGARRGDMQLRGRLNEPFSQV